MFSPSPRQVVNPHDARRFESVPLVQVDRSSQTGLKGRIEQLNRWICPLLSSLCALAIVGCETTVRTKLPGEGIPQAPVTLSPGDVVKITFPDTPDFNQTQKIQADGKINLPIVGEVDAAGRTISSLQRKLEALYQPQLQNAGVVVSLDTSLMPVVVAGAVNKPGKYFIDRPTTVLQAVMEAGGPDQFGTLGKVSVIRVIGGQQRTEVLDLRPTLRGQVTSAFYVRGGDVILVGEGRF
jgi:protein involved in polysaccharide export with SLBB domain